MPALPQPGHSPLVASAVEARAAAGRRERALCWAAVNAALLALFVGDLWMACPGHTSALHAVELAAAALLAGSLLLHAARLLPPRRKTSLTARQARLLGLDDSTLDSSFRIVETSELSSSSGALRAAGEDTSLLSLSRSWSSAGEEGGAGAGAGGGSPRGGAGGGGSPRGARTPPLQDHFIADATTLEEYLRSVSPTESPPAPPAPPARPAPRYQLATVSTESGGGEAGGAEAGGALWRRLRVDPARLTTYNLNLRRWLHMTILARLERELEAAGGGAGGAGSARLEPYLQQRAHQAYVAQRIRELARGGCLSAYKWDGGGDDWNDSKPTDAEIIMHLFATYVDSQAPRVAAAAGAGGAGAGAFSARHVSAAPARPPRSPRTLALHRASSRPPHYLLLLGEDTIEVCSGRNNVFHTLLVFLAAAARGAGGGGGGAVAGGLQLGRAGLNLLWVIGQ